MQPYIYCFRHRLHFALRYELMSKVRLLYNHTGETDRRNGERLHVFS